MKNLLIISALVLSFSSFADSSVGCGLGQLVFKKNSIVSALLRATTNGTFSSQLFGITTGTSGCAKHSIVKNEMAPQYFAEANFEQLKLDLAKGEGSYLTAFLVTLDCEQTSHQGLSTLSQKNFGNLVEQDTPQGVVKNVKSMINGSQFSKSCQNII